MLRSYRRDRHGSGPENQIFEGLLSSRGQNGGGQTEEKQLCFEKF